MNKFLFTIISILIFSYISAKIPYELFVLTRNGKALNMNKTNNLTKEQLEMLDN